MTDRCLKCGRCAAVCPVQKMGYPSFVASRLAGTGESELWLCSNCWLCQETCPVGIDLWSVKALLRRRTAKVPAGIRAGYEHLAACGFIFPVDEELNELRADQGLESFRLPSKQVIDFLLHGGK